MFHRLRLRAFFGLFTSLKQRPRFVNKNPENSLRIPFLKKIFPDAIFIHLIRDGRAVVNSNYKQTELEPFRQKYPFCLFPKPPQWRKYQNLPLILQFAHQWVDLLGHIRKVAITELSSENYIEIYYEDFCLAPHETLRKIDQFCGLPLSKRNYSTIPVAFNSQNFKWKDEFSNVQVKEIEEILGDTLIQYGY